MTRTSSVAVALAVASAAWPLGASAHRFGEFETLVGAEGVYESAHDVEVVFERGLARVTVHLRFEHDGAGRSEVLYRLPAPHGAALASLRVCVGTRCRVGLGGGAPVDLDPYALALTVPGSSNAPIARVAPERDARGDYFFLSAAPVSASSPLDVTLVYVAETEVSGGVETLVLPARGEHALAAAASVHVRAPGHASSAVDAPGAVPPDRSVTIRATLAPGVHAHALRARCGTSSCLRVRVTAGASRVRRDVVVLLDASPSMEDVDPGRIERTLRALLDTLTDDSTVRVAWFARRARWAVARRRAPDAIDSSAILATPPALGPESRLDAVVPLLAGAVVARDTLVVVVSDGRVRDSTSISALGVELSALAVGDGVPNAALADQASSSGGAIVQLGARADASPAELARHVALVSAPLAARAVTVSAPGRVERRPLRAGEALASSVLLGDADPPPSITIDGRAIAVRDAPPALAPGLGVMLANRVGPHDPRRVLVAVHPLDLDAAEKWAVPRLRAYPPVRAALGQLDASFTETTFAGGCRTYRGQRLCRFPVRRWPIIRCSGGCGIRGSLSKEVIARRMRTLEPAVRACFRRERRGRPDYQARASYELALQDREILVARVSGEGVTPSLERCMLDALDTLVIPRADHDGVTVVIYPFVARPEARAAPVALGDDVDARLEALFGGESPAPLPAPALTPSR